MNKYHHSIGRLIRNNWKLWSKEDNNLKIWFKNKGIWHADDMSGIILTSYWRWKNNEPFKIDEQIKFYHTHWKKMGLNPWDGSRSK